MSLKVGEISFANFLPLAAKGAEYPFKCSVTTAIPSTLNNACRRGEFDISPISFYAYPAIEKDYALLPNFCIASDGEVMSVKLFSKFDIAKLAGKKIYLTPDSESSIGAFCAVCKKRYGYNPRDFACANADEADALFLIGDKALAFDKPADYTCDLGTLWKETFDTPLVFAAIAVKREIFGEYKETLAEFYAANLKEFYARKDFYCERAVQSLASETFKIDDARKYFERLTYKISDAAFANSRAILHGKAD
jgi:Predicted periplasmic solute-binding protein